jgi:hypothetical protein
MNVDCKEWHNGHGIYLEQLVETTEKVKILGFHIQTTDLPIMNANYYTRFYQKVPENNNNNNNSVALAREQIIPTEQPPLVGEVSANFCR